MKAEMASAINVLPTLTGRPTSAANPARPLAKAATGPWVCRAAT